MLTSGTYGQIQAGEGPKERSSRHTPAGRRVRDHIAGAVRVCVRRPLLRDQAGMNKDETI